MFELLRLFVYFSSSSISVNVLFYLKYKFHYFYTNFICSIKGVFKKFFLINIFPDKFILILKQ